MRFLVLGAGALGGLFGARLLKGGADVTFLARPNRAAQLRRDGLIAKTQDGELRFPAKTVQKGMIDGPYDTVLLCCKAYDLESAMNDLAPAIGDQSAVLPLLNGIRHITLLEKRFGSKHVLGGVTAINAALTPDGVIVQSQLRVNFNVIGELTGTTSQRIAAIRVALERGGIPVTVSENITAVMWNKFFGFASIAAIASLTRSRAGPIARSSAGSAFVEAAMEECNHVCEAEGYPTPSQMLDVVRGIYSQSDSAYGPSLLVDMENGRPTEGEHTIGDLVSRATRHGISTPILGAALCNLQAYELSRMKDHS
jgi:2-dehydropantoate 2-reductase